MNLRKIALSLLVCLCFTSLLAAQDNPNEIALQRIEEAKTTANPILDLSSLGLTELPPQIADMDSVEILLLGGNQFTSFPTIITSLDNLKNLDLSHNDLTSLAPEIGNLSNLELLHLSANDITSLPPEIGNLSNLRSLSLDFNALTSLPDEFVNLSSLVALWLNSNQLTSLPPNFGMLTNLCILDLSGNQFQRLPELGKLESLNAPNCSLSIVGNPLLTPEVPLSVATQAPLILQASQTPITIIITVMGIVTATPEMIVYPSEQATIEVSLGDAPIEGLESSWQYERLLLGGAACLGIVVSLVLGLRLRRDGRKRKQK